MCSDPSVIAFFRVIQQTACPEHCRLPLGEAAADGDFTVSSVKRHGAAVQTGVDAGEGQGLALGQGILVIGGGKGQGQDTGIDEVGGVDTGEALGDDRPDT